MVGPTEPAFAWYRLEGREAASFLVISLFLLVLCIIVSVREPGARPIPVTQGGATPAVIYINRAGVAELAALPGIGPRKAERIIAARKAGAIHSLEEMSRAAGGIPEASRKRMQPFVRFED